MASDKLASKLNELMNGELHAHNTYMGMAAWASNNNLEGVKAFLLGHAAEERGHMMRFFNYLSELGAPISFNAVAEPKIAANDVRGIFLRVQQDEQNVSRNIYAVIDLARAESDYATDQFLQWFAAEQHEEEQLARTILDTIDLIGEGPHALYMVDRELAKLAAEHEDEAA